MKNNKIHIAFGFHVNCYHSYRGDTNDNLGFGSDIRIIRKIIATLNDFNEKGIPVKATWDCENFFSLEKILPEYAPDIIDGIRQRVKKYGDENIIMGYNNGALSAMNEDELEASVSLAVSNENGSGLRDIFGECEMIVRPQEVMFTPSQVTLYNKLGVKALCLYYSCVPFDAFRTIVPKLPDEIAFNPVTYTYKGESITVVPTYSNPDVCDAGCLRAWVKELHAKQLSGEIDNDMLIFINMDADAIFWESLDLGPLSHKIANTDGIRGLVREVCDLDYICFDTVGGYLRKHKPIGNITFTQDTADGNFTGYASWSEKPFNRKIWTAIERARAMAKVNAERDSLSPSFEDRVLLLSTTHFGLATPVLNISRERSAVSLADSAVNAEIKAIGTADKITIYNITNSDFQCIQLKLNKRVDDLSALKIKSDGLIDYAIVPMDSENNSVFVMLKFAQISDKYFIDITEGEPEKVKDFTNIIGTDVLQIKISVHGNIYEVLLDGHRIGDSDFLKSYITYDNKQYDFERKAIAPLCVGGSARGVRVIGEIHLPDEIESGSFEYDLFTISSSQAVFVRATVKYPYTLENNSISTENSSLGRYSDMKWTEVVPFQLTPKLSGDISVVKRNFMGDISSYRTQSFPECDSKNSHLDSFNHHLTGGFVGLTDGNCGLLVANARQVLNSMAHCPMRLEEDKTVRMNPFGTYYGKQRHHWSRAKGQILETYTLVTPQGKSIAPSYNGSSETSMLALYPLTTTEPDYKQLSEINVFSEGAVALCPENAIVSPFYDDNAVIHKPAAQTLDEKDLMSPVLSGIAGNLGKYITKGTKAIFHIITQQIKSK